MWRQYEEAVTFRSFYSLSVEKHVMTTTEKLYETVKDLPEPIVAELLDFAEFLRQKRRHGKPEQVNDEMLIALKGGLENSRALAGDPIEIQEKMRNEWN
jgi:hypothetical protein